MNYEITVKEDGEYIVFSWNGSDINDMLKSDIGYPDRMIRLYQKNWWTPELEKKVKKLCGVK